MPLSLWYADELVAHDVVALQDTLQQTTKLHLPIHVVTVEANFARRLLAPTLGELLADWASTERQRATWSARRRWRIEQHERRYQRRWPAPGQPSYAQAVALWLRFRQAVLTLALRNEARHESQRPDEAQ